MNANPALPVMAAQNRILRTLDHAGAVAPESARLPGDLGLRESLALEGLIRRELVERLGDGRVFLHPERVGQWRQRRRLRLLLGLFLTGLVLFVMYALRRP